MADNTTNYNLTKPSAEEFYDVGVQNGNMDIIDDELKKLNDGKAPSGHGLGTVSEVKKNIPFNDVLQYGTGFYQLCSKEDAPLHGRF